jgi:hypothetical protein
MAEVPTIKNKESPDGGTYAVITPDVLGYNPQAFVVAPEPEFSLSSSDLGVDIQNSAVAAFNKIAVAAGPLIGCPPVRDFALPSFSASPVALPTPPTAPNLEALPPLSDITPPVFTGLGYQPQQFDGVAPATPSFPVSPDAPALNEITAFALDDTPILGGNDPNIIFPTPPEDFSGIIPANPLLADPLVPATPDDTLPQAPALETIVLPTAPNIFIPSFLATLADGPIAPTDTFSYNDVPYTATLLTDLEDKLEFFLSDTALGLEADIWQAIWERATEREDFLAIKARDESSIEFAARGFSLPPGAQVARDQEIIQGNRDMSASLSREQAIEEARLEVEQVRFGITSTIELQIALIRNHSDIQARALDVARLTVELPQALFRAQIDAHNAEIAAYRVEVEIFNVLLQAEITKIDIFKTEIEAQGLINQINATKIANYRAQIDAVIATFDLYKAQLETGRFVLDQNRIKLEEFQALIAAFEAESRVLVANANIYESKVMAERIKVDVRKTEVDAFSAQVGAFAAVHDAKGNSKRQEIDVERFKIESFTAEISAVQSQITALTAELTADVEVFNSFIAKFSAETDAEARRVTADTGIFGSEIEAFSATSRRDTDLATATAARSQATASLFTAEVTAFGAEALANTAVFEAEVGRYGQDIGGYGARVTRDLGEARICADQLTAQLQLLQEQIIAEARIAGQIAAAQISQFSRSVVTSHSSSSSQNTSTTGITNSGGQAVDNFNYACDCPAA